MICEPFFQWVIETSNAEGLPPLEKAGVSLVEDVRPYERMKLGILNGGHSLAGLIGKAMGYAYRPLFLRNEAGEAYFYG